MSLDESHGLSASSPDIEAGLARPPRAWSTEGRTKHKALSESIISGLAAAVDALIISGTGMILYTVHPGLDAADPFWRYVMVIGLYTALVVQSFSFYKLYRFNSLVHPVRQMKKSLTICMSIFGLLLLTGFALKVSADYSRSWTFAWFIISTLLIQSSRFALWALVRRKSRTGELCRNIVIYGAGEHGQRLARYLRELDQPWNRIVGVFDDRATRVADEVAGHSVSGGLQDLVDYARTHPVDEIVISLPGNCQKRVRDIVDMLVPLPVNVRLCPEFIGTDFMNRHVSYHYGVPMLSLMDKPVAGWPAISKALFDYALGSMLLLAALPVMALCALAIKLDSPGPLLFRQKRYGFNNQLIDVFKFRTMFVEQTDANADKLTERDDPRVTRVGAILRRFSLDELPQLFNVVRGDMSIVGPRPHATQAKAAGKLYEDVVSDYAVRHKVKPGVTGWAQVRGWRGNTETEDDIRGRVEHDLYYIENWSLFFDLYILLLTFRAVVVGENSY